MGRRNRPILPLTAVADGHYCAEQEREKNVIGNRILEARRARKLSQADVSRLLAAYEVVIGPNGLRKWEVGMSIPNAYQLLAVCQCLGIEVGPNLASNGFRELNDEGLRKLQSYREDLIASGRYAPETVQEPEDPIVCRKMPLSDLTASAGTGQFLDEGNYEMVAFPAFEIPEKADFALRISGDSMEPSYRDGQIVWVQKTQQLERGDVGIFVYDGCGYIKSYDERTPEADRAEAFTDTAGCMHPQPVLRSYNSAYEPVVINPKLGFSIVGRVVH